MAKVTMAVDPKIKVPADSSAKISSDGLLGGAYVAIEPGGDEVMLKAGNEISHTQGTIDLLTVLASAVGGAAKSEDKGAGAQDAIP
jgi:phospholipid/cholesterol/gamma-HCH transport system substrate-binding protein